MNNKFLIILSISIGIIVIPVILGCLFFTCVLNSTNNKIIVAVLANSADTEVVKEEIINIPHVKKIQFEYKDEQWSEDSEDLQNIGMGANYKNKIKIKVDKQKNLERVYSKVKEKEYVEHIGYFPDTEIFDSVGKAFKVEE